MTTIYVMERHDQLLDIWRRKNVKDLRICHFDFHCDMRGLVIDRQSGIAYPHRRFDASLDQGNFLTHAILEGRVRGIRWVHDIPGGREYDLGTVNYSDDISSRIMRLWNGPRDNAIRLDYESLAFTNWNGLKDGEFLDFCWDIFACKINDKKLVSRNIDKKLDEFFSREWKYSPTGISICYSPQYSHETREQFENFISEMVKLFNGEVERLPEPMPEERKPSVYAKILPKTVHKTLYPAKDSAFMWAHRRGIF